MPPIKKTDRLLLIFLLALASFVALFVFRAADDNRLTSWQWIFEGVSAGKIFVALAISLLPAYFISGRFAMPGAGALFFISFAVSAVFWREPEVIIDASRYFTQAKHLELYGIGYFIREWGGKIDAWTDLPLVPFLYGLVFKFAGEVRLFIQILSSVMFSLTAVLTLLIGRELYDEETGRAGGMFLLAIPYLHTQVPLMLVDAPSMFFLTLSLYSFIMALRRGGAMIFFSALSISLAVFCKYSLWPMFSALAVYMLVHGLLNSPREALKRGAAVAAFTALFIAPALIYKYEVFVEQAALLSGYQGPGLKRWAESHISTFLFQTHPFVTASALFSVYYAFRNKDKQYVVLLWLPLLMVVFGIKRSRYVMPLLPMVSLMAAYGIREIGDAVVRRFAVYAAVFCSLVIAVFVYLPFLERVSMVNLREAGRFLDTLDVDEVRAYVVRQESEVNPAVAVPLLDLYTRKKLSFDYKPSMPPSDIGASSVRFTWQYENPVYYAPGEASPGALAAISGGPVYLVPEDIRESLPDYKKRRIFGVPEKVFKFGTVATVFYDK